MSDGELLKIALSWTDGDEPRARRLVEAYRAGGRLREQMDMYEAAGLGRGLKEVEANIQRRIRR